MSVKDLYIGMAISLIGFMLKSYPLKNAAKDDLELVLGILKHAQKA